MSALRKNTYRNSIDERYEFATNSGSQLKQTVMVSEDRLSVNLKRHSVILPMQSSTRFF
jgi:hypothetical protein